MADTPVSLLDQLQNQADEASWRRFFNLYTPLLRKWLRRFRIQDADEDDVVQQTLTAVYKGLPEFRHNQKRGAFRRWLRNTLVHRVLSFFRNRKRHLPGSGYEEVIARLQVLEDPSSEMSQQWDRDHDHHVIQHLQEMVRGEFQPTTWKVFDLLLEGASVEEAARSAGVSTNAAVIAKCRVLNRLRQLAQGMVD